MRLYIRNPEAHRLAKAIAGATGQSMTHVVTEALRRRFAEIDQLRRRASFGELRAIANRSAALARGGYESHDDLLYDGDGLPK
ncbi:type II toxin-antitoxin system VapB family antitoxin [Sphingomonas sp. MMS24-J13]|uniref:type II toxin-antitoxin system VapB family antitoxin n=1 Tax=Sphingomonas sp. MMS24-J13 TaxID=3238686 RepID=UPI00385028C4